MYEFLVETRRQMVKLYFSLVELFLQKSSYNYVISYLYIYCYRKIIRSSHRRCSMEICILKNFTKFTGKHLLQNLFFNKVAGLRPVTLLKKRLWYSCFLVNFAKFLRALFLQNTSGGCFWIFHVI